MVYIQTLPAGCNSTSGQCAKAPCNTTLMYACPPLRYSPDNSMQHERHSPVHLLSLAVLKRLVLKHSTEPRGYSIDVYASNSLPLRLLRSMGSSLISTPGPTGLELLCAGKICSGYVSVAIVCLKESILLPLCCVALPQL